MLFLIIITIIYALLFLPMLYMAGMSPMLADDPANAARRIVLVTIYSLLTLPVVVIVAVVGAWALYFQGSGAWSVAVSLLARNGAAEVEVML